jgi:hypothetical protein
MIPILASSIVSDAAYSWFWQPPIEGEPGLMMIMDDHPGPDRPDVPLVVEELRNILHEVEAQIPVDVALFQMRIYSREPTGFWFEILFDGHSRRFMTKKPDFTQRELDRLWESRLAG